jgi:hypothetical protein
MIFKICVDVFSLSFLNSKSIGAVAVAKLIPKNAPVSLVVQFVLKSRLKIPVSRRI